MKWFVVLFCSFLILMTGCNSESTEKDHAAIEEDEAYIVEAPEEDIDEKNVFEKHLEEENSHETVEIEQVEQIEQTVVPQYTLNETNFLIQPKNEGVNEQVVLLTIDDAPDQYGAEMAQILFDLDANAIFFVNGIFINKNDGKEQLKKIHELGFEIGNHTMSHKNLSKLSAEEQRKEIVELNDLIEEIIGERPRFFRAPYGVNTDISKQVVEEEGMQWMNWTYGYDYFEQYTNAKALADIMVNAPELMNGANLLMHDRKWTKEALEDIVIGLRNKGYEIVDPKEIQ
ncbi:polysaccharide deacetylase family protein [Alkalihalobacterium sp. APHAB7]|uniref:polysaccharide deacetylase family protein n=1 Tax=Alkalihalobacterium sp. APHAB7 TaxID=3402081 RepID=UPI003AACBED3